MATTTNYGWTTPDNTAYVKDGASAIRTLGSSIDTTLNSITSGKNVGLVHINTTTLTAASAVNIANCFSADFDNYLIQYSITATTGSASSVFALRNNSTTVTTNYASTVQFALSSSTYATRATSAFFCFAQGAGDAAVINIYRPFLATTTSWNSVANQGQAVGTDAGYHTLASSYNSLAWSSAGTSTGTIRIYGYRNS